MIFANDDLADNMRLDKAKRNVAEASQYFENDVVSIARIISMYYPLEILKMAAWEERRIHLSKNDQSSILEASFLPLLVQSIVQSKKFYSEKGFSANRDIKEKDWNRIKTLTKDAFKRLTWYIENYAVIQVKEGHIASSHYTLYRDSLLNQFCFPTLPDEVEEQYRELAQSIFVEDEDNVSNLLSIDSSFFVNELSKICDNGKNGISNLSSESSIIHAEIDLKVAQLKKADPSKSEKELLSKVIRDGGYSYKLDELRRKRDDFDLFEVERISLLSTNVLKQFSVAVGSFEGDFLKDGFMIATKKPFLRFADRFYLFTGRTFFSSLPVVIKEAGLIKSDKLQKLFSTYILKLFNETDSVDVYQWRGNRFDIALLPTLKWKNWFDDSIRFESVVGQIEEEKIRKPQLGHKRLLVYCDNNQKLEQLDEKTFSISLCEIIRICKDESLTKQFYHTLLGPFQYEKGEMAIFDDVIDDDYINEEASQDEIEPLSSDVEFEYDSQDDDEKANEIEKKYNQEEEKSFDYGYKLPTVEELENLKERYALPDKFKNERVIEELDALETDEFDQESIDDELPSLENEELADIDDDD